MLMGFNGRCSVPSVSSEVVSRLSRRYCVPYALSVNLASLLLCLASPWRLDGSPVYFPAQEEDARVEAAEGDAQDALGGP